MSLHPQFPAPPDPKRRIFLREHLFGLSLVDVADLVVLRKLSEPDAGMFLHDSFNSAAKALTVWETGMTRMEDRICLKETWPFRTDCRTHLTASKSIFNKVLGEPSSDGIEIGFAVLPTTAYDYPLYHLQF